MMTSGFVERRGRGWPVIQHAVAKDGGAAELVVDPDRQSVRVVLWRAPQTML